MALSESGRFPDGLSFVFQTFPLAPAIAIHLQPPSHPPTISTVPLPTNAWSASAVACRHVVGYLGGRDRAGWHRMGWSSNWSRFVLCEGWVRWLAWAITWARKVRTPSNYCDAFVFASIHPFIQPSSTTNPNINHDKTKKQNRPKKLTSHTTLGTTTQNLHTNTRYCLVSGRANG